MRLKKSMGSLSAPSALRARSGAVPAAQPQHGAASRSWISPSPPSEGGEGWGEEERFYWFPLSSVLSPLVPHGERMGSLMQPCVLAVLLTLAPQRGAPPVMALSHVLIYGAVWRLVTERLASPDTASSHALDH